MERCEVSERIWQGTTEDELTVIASDDCEIGIRADDKFGRAICYLRPEEAREVAAQLLALADKIEGKNAAS